VTDEPKIRGAQAGDPVVQHGRLPRTRPIVATVKLLAIGLAVVLVATVSITGIAFWSLSSAVKPGVHLTQLNGQTAAPPTVGAISGAVNLLLVGTDTRTGQGGEFDTQTQLAGSSGAGSNDVTILIHIAANHQSAMVVSFPRDTIVPIPACPTSNGGFYSASYGAMLNTTLARGGLDCPVLTIEKLTGVTIPYAAEISFDGVASMSNAVGGVTVCVASPINDRDTGLQLSAGEHSIAGQQALEFLRTRHGVGDGSDLGRISSQEVFLSSLVRKVQSGGELSNPLTLYSLANAAVHNMQLSDSLVHVDTLVSMAAALKNIPLQNVVMLQYPTTGDPANENRVIPYVSADLAVNAALNSDQPVKLSGTTGRGAELATGAPATTTPAATPTATPTSGSTTQTPAAIVLPSTITGQNAAQQTCAKGNAGG
jgi:LCP family protein required for cell wall assembly